jgi:hypothetical protein
MFAYSNYKNVLLWKGYIYMQNVSILQTNPKKCKRTQISPDLHKLLSQEGVGVRGANSPCCTCRVLHTADFNLQLSILYPLITHCLYIKEKK